MSREPLVAPDQPMRDPGDPLSPDRIRNLDLSVEQAIQDRDILLRIARNPQQEPGWAQVTSVIKRYLAEAHAERKLLEATLADRQRICNLMANLPMTSPDNIQALSDAQDAVREVEQAIDKVDGLISRLTL